MKNSFLISILFLSGLVSPRAHAYLFQNSYIKFEMPENWQCQLVEADWVCKSRAQKSAEEATIILTAKEAGPEDTMESYARHLAQPQSNAARGTGAASALISMPKITIIKGQSWIDSIHRDSEIKNYFTRYLATIKDRIAVAVTFSAHKDVYTNYADQFFKTANSLEIIATKTLVTANGQAVVPGGGNGQIEVPKNDMTPGGEVIVKEAAPAGGNRMKAIFFVMAVLVAAATMYYLLRSRK